MKLFIKDDTVGMVMSKTELAALYAGHSMSIYSTVISRLYEDKSFIGEFIWTKEDDLKLHRTLREFLKDHKNG